MGKARHVGECSERLSPRGPVSIARQAQRRGSQTSTANVNASHSSARTCAARRCCTLLLLLLIVMWRTHVYEPRMLPAVESLSRMAEQKTLVLSALL